MPGVQSVDRALALLGVLADRRSWCSLTDLAESLDVHKSTAFRLLSTLQVHGLVEQDPATSQYRLGFGVLRLAGALTWRPDVMRYANPVCERLSTETDETVNVAVLEDFEAVNIAQFIPGSTVVSQNWLGRRTPLHCTSTGKVFLAHMAPRRRNEALAGPLERLTEHTVVSRRALTAQLREIRAQGYACAIEELEIGLRAVAAPIRSAHDDVLAAVSVSGPASRIPVDMLPRIGEMVREAALEISRAIGYQGEG